jgi:GDP-fucose transporter C1
MLDFWRPEKATRGSLTTLLSVQTVLFLLQALLNKSALLALPAPLLLLLVESFITMLMILAGHRLGYYKLKTLDHHVSTIVSLRWLILAKLMSSITRSYCMEAVDGTVFNLVRGLVLPFAVGLSAVFLTPPTRTSLLPIAFICVGFYMGTMSDHTEISDVGGAYGLAIGVLSSFFAALDLTVTKSTLEEYSLYDLLYVTNMAAVVATLPMILLGTEYTDHLVISSMTYEDRAAMRSFLFKAFVCGVFTFFGATLALVQLKLTSPTTHQITTGARGVLQSILSVWILGERLEKPQMVSILVITAGTIWYAYIKEREFRIHERSPQYMKEKASNKV